MQTRSATKKIQTKKSARDSEKTVDPAEALALVVGESKERFDAAVEVHVHTGIDARKGDQVIRGSVTLPHGTGKTKRVAVFADGEKAMEAKEAGADLVGGQELINEIKQSGKVDFDIAIATPDMMRLLTSIAKILGPKGLMPSPKSETVTGNVAQGVRDIKKGREAFKNDASGNVHQVIGRRSFTAEQLLENYIAFMETLRRARPSTAKGVFIQSITLSSTMGKGVRITLT